MDTNQDQILRQQYDEMSGNVKNLTERELLAVRHVARLLGVHESTVRHWADSGVLESFRIGPRQDRRITAESVRRTLVRIGQ